MTNLEKNVPLSSDIIIINKFIDWTPSNLGTRSCKTFYLFKSAVQYFLIDKKCEITLHLGIFALPCSYILDSSTGWYKLQIADNFPNLPLQYCTHEYVYLTGPKNLIWPQISYKPSNMLDTLVPLIKNNEVTYIEFFNGMSRPRSGFSHKDYNDYHLQYYSISSLQKEKKNLQFMENTIFHHKKQNFAARQIQKQWKNVITNPDHKICRKRLYNEYKELNNE